MKPELKAEELLAHLALQCVEDSARWFPDAPQDMMTQIVCLVGEVGEFANIAKKIRRGSLDFNDARVRHELAMELTDVFIYLLNIAGNLRLDLKKSYDLKRGENEKRFMDPNAAHRLKVVKPNE